MQRIVKLLYEPRLNRLGETGTFLHKSYLKFAYFPSNPTPKSFESLIATLDTGNQYITFTNVYCPPFLSLSDFFLPDFISSELLIMSDFSMQSDTVNCASEKVQNLLSGFDHIFPFLSFLIHNMFTHLTF